MRQRTNLNENAVPAHLNEVEGVAAADSVPMTHTRSNQLERDGNRQEPQGTTETRKSTNRTAAQRLHCTDVDDDLLVGLRKARGLHTRPDVRELCVCVCVYVL